LVATTPQGNVVLAGWFMGTVSFGGSPLVAGANSGNIFVAEFDCSGKHLWSKSFGEPPTFGDDEVAALATGGDGSILLTGSFRGTLDFGTGPLTSVGFSDGFIAKLDAAGNAMFAKSFGGMGDSSTGAACALDQTGNAYVAGSAFGQQDFGGGSIGSALQPNAVLVEFDTTGNHVFSKSFGQGGGLWTTVAVAPSGDVILAGLPNGTLDFGGGPLPPAAAFATTLTANGSYVWTKTWGPPSTYAQPITLAIGPAGEIVFAGRYQGQGFGTIDFGGGPLPGSSNAAAYVVKLTSAGAHVFSQGAGPGVPTSSAISDIYSVAVNASGEVYLAGYFGGTISFGGGPVASTGGYDALFAKFSPSGALTWFQHFGTPPMQTGAFANSVALSAAGAPYLAGTYSGGGFNLGNGALPVATAGAAFLGQLAP
jgi:hypothetical protein